MSRPSGTARSRMAVDGLELAATELAGPTDTDPTEILAEQPAVELAVAWRSGTRRAVDQMTVEGLELAATELAGLTEQPAVELAAVRRSGRPRAVDQMTVESLELAASALGGPTDPTEILAEQLAVELAAA